MLINIQTLTGSVEVLDINDWHVFHMVKIMLRNGPKNHLQENIYIVP